MDGANASILALIAAMAVLGGGWVIGHVFRMGADYVSSRGNPRNRAAAHESGRDILIGALIMGGAAAIGAFLVATLRF